MPSINQSITSDALSDIRVVPNPYVAATVAESSLPPGFQVEEVRGKLIQMFQPMQ